MDGAGKQERLWSLDAFRGFDMLMIMGMDHLVIALGVLVFGGTGGWLADQMRHPDWFGLSFYDTIFPTFLFIAGISFPFSFAKQRERGQSVFRIDRKIVVRGVLLIALGLVYNRILRLDFPDASSLSVEGNFVGWLDRRFMPGKLYQSGLCEPSGVFCNFFATATAMLGMFAGEIVRSADATGAVILAAGYVALCWLLLVFLDRKKAYFKV